MLPIKTSTSMGASPFLKAPAAQPLGGLLERMLAGTPPGPGLLSMAPAAEPRPSIWDGVADTPGLGWLANPQRRARLAATFEGSTLHPNEARMEWLRGQLGEDHRPRGLLGLLGLLGGQQAPGAEAKPLGEALPQPDLWQRQTFY